MKKALIGSASTLLFCLTVSALSEELPRYRFGPGTERQYRRQELPAGLKADDKDPILGFLVDLNGDGKNDFVQLIQMNCGTGGCTFQLLDGATSDYIAELFGSSVFVMTESTNGWPNLKVYARAGAQSGALATLVFDGDEYVESSSVGLRGKENADLWEKYRSVPELKPSR